jgi:hypothetical protein
MNTHFFLQPADDHSRLQLSFSVEGNGGTVQYVLSSVLYHKRNHYESLGRDASRQWWHNNGTGLLKNMGSDFFTVHMSAGLSAKRPRLFFYVAYNLEATQVLGL